MIANWSGRPKYAIMRAPNSFIINAAISDIHVDKIVYE